MEKAKEGIYKKQERNFSDDVRLVIGTSFINHKVRLYLGLSLREYVLLDFIHNWHEKKKDQITFGDIFKHTGLRPRYIQGIYAKMGAKGLLFKDTDGKVKTTIRWSEAFNSSELILELWKLLNTGNKQKATSALKKALRVDTFENIKKGLEAYLEFLSKTDQFPQHLSTFLNAKNKAWNTEWDASMYQKKTGAPMQEQKVVTGPRSAFD